MYVYIPTIICNLAHGITCWTHAQMVIGSNPESVFVHCLQL